MVDDEIYGNVGLDEGGVAAQTLYGGAHGGQVYEARHSGEVLQEDAGRFEGQFTGRRMLRVPPCQLDDVIGSHLEAVLVPEHGLEENPDGEGQPGDVAHTLLFQLVEAIDVGLARTGVEGGPSIEAVMSLHGHPFASQVPARPAADR